MPSWLHTVAVTSLVIAAVSALIIAGDLLRGGAQHMWIMDVVWPVTALWAGPVAVWAYVRWGRAGSRRAVEAAKRRGEPPPTTRQSTAVAVARSTSHCGSGCTVGDMVAAWVALGLPFALFGHRLFGEWVYEYVAAFGVGILFQYFTIKPMKNLSRSDGLKAAFKADSLSLTAWQVGMYGWMAIATFAIFGRELEPTGPVFWFMMRARDGPRLPDELSGELVARLVGDQGADVIGRRGSRRAPTELGRLEGHRRGDELGTGARAGLDRSSASAGGAAPRRAGGGTQVRPRRARMGRHRRVRSGV